jgi:hypothetical protein
LRRYWFTILFYMACGAVAAQTTSTFTSYTIGRGLSSNNVYKTVLDKKGFLWIATENGLCRFDGSEIKTYTTTSGLPDNDIPYMDLDGNGVLWALPFQKYPVYYNDRTDRFENDYLKQMKQQVVKGGGVTFNMLKYGGISIISDRRKIFTVRGQQVRQLPLTIENTKNTVSRVYEFARDSFIIVTSYEILLMGADKVYYRQSIPIGINHNSIYFRGGHLFLPWENSLLHYQLRADNGALTTLPAKTYPFTIRYFNHTGRQYFIISASGATYAIDGESLEVNNIVFDQGAFSTFMMEDRDGNTWLSTRDGGLVRIQPKKVATLDAVAAMQQNFNAVAVSGKRIYAGNNKGELYIYQPPYALKKIVLGSNAAFDFWVRKILVVGDKLFISNEGGDFWLDAVSGRILNSTMSKTKVDILAGKTALRISDTVLLMGSFYKATRWNMRLQAATDSVKIRVTALGATAGRTYIGSTNGLFEWAHGNLLPLSTALGAFSYRVATLTGTADSLLWVGLGADSLLVIRNNQLLKSIAIGKDIPGTTCKTLCSNQPGVVWLGTDKGLTRINYRFENGQLKYGSAWFGAADGLANDNVNDIALTGDTVYVATSGGISTLYANQQQVVNEIPVIVTNIYAEGASQGAVRQVSVPYGQGSVRIEFSAIDLSGYTPRFTYRVNNGDWQYTNQHFVEVQFTQGQNTVEIAAIKRNGEASTQSAKVTISIKTPFWRTSAFWFASILGLSALGFYIIVRRNRLKRKQQQEKAAAERKLLELEMQRMTTEQQVAEEKLLTEKKLAQLEMQALRAQINPHFVFNCLNSIKSFIHEKDYTQADKYLDSFSVLLRNTLETSVVSTITLQQEMEYLQHYLQLEQLRFNNQFTCTVSASNIERPEKVQIPSMLIQPYVENAIRHGMRHLKNKKGHIGVTFTNRNGFIECTVDDDGVGRDAAAAFKSGMHIEYQGRGMQISNRRAQLHNATVTIIDKADEAGNAAGTTVTITIPEL